MELYEAALIGLQHQYNEIKRQMAEVESKLKGKSLKRGPAYATASTNGASGARANGASAPKRGMSLAGRKRIAAAQRERWARVKAAAAKASRTAKAERKYQTPPRRRKPTSATVAA